LRAPSPPGDAKAEERETEAAHQGKQQPPRSA